MITFGITGTKWDMFETSIELFAKGGYANVSIRDIAKAVGVKSASIYYHFENKEEILSLIYKFYEENYIALLPKLEEVLDMVGKIHPYDVFRKLIVRYDEEMRNIMIRITETIMKQKDHDSRANEILVKLYLDVPKERFGAILKKMIEIDVIEPLDIDTWINVLAHFDFLTFIRSYSENIVEDEEWNKGRELIFTLVHVKEN